MEGSNDPQRVLSSSVSDTVLQIQDALHIETAQNQGKSQDYPRSESEIRELMRIMEAIRTFDWDLVQQEIRNLGPESYKHFLQMAPVPDETNKRNVLHHIVIGTPPEGFIEKPESERMRIETVEALLHHMPAEMKSVVINQADIDGRTPLHYAMASQFPETLVRLVQLLLNHGAITSSKDIISQTPLHYAASNPIGAAVIKSLKHTEIDWNIRDKNFDTPLHVAAAQLSESSTKALLEIGVDHTPYDNSLLTPLDFARTVSLSTACITSEANMAAAKATIDLLEEYDRNAQEARTPGTFNSQGSSYDFSCNLHLLSCKFTGPQTAANTWTSFKTWTTNSKPVGEVLQGAKPWLEELVDQRRTRQIANGHPREGNEQAAASGLNDYLTSWIHLPLNNVSGMKI